MSIPALYRQTQEAEDKFYSLVSELFSAIAPTGAEIAHAREVRFCDDLTDFEICQQVILDRGVGVLDGRAPKALGTTPTTATGRDKRARRRSSMLARLAK